MLRTSGGVPQRVMQQARPSSKLGGKRRILFFRCVVKRNFLYILYLYNIYNPLKEKSFFMLLNESIGQLDEHDLNEQFPVFYKKLASHINAKLPREVGQIVVKQGTPVIQIDQQIPVMLFVCRTKGVKNLGAFLVYDGQAVCMSSTRGDDFNLSVRDGWVYLSAGEYCITKTTLI